MIKLIKVCLCYITWITWLGYAALGVSILPFTRALLPITEYIRPSIKLDVHGNSTFLIVDTLCLTTFCLFHALSHLGLKAGSIFISIVTILSYTAEYIGVNYGVLFGKYHFSPSMGPQIGNIPILLPALWVSGMYLSFSIVRGIMLVMFTTPSSLSSSKRHKEQRKEITEVKFLVPTIIVILLSTISTAFVMTSWDFISDPLMSNKGGHLRWEYSNIENIPKNVISKSDWVWEEGGEFFGVPSSNFIGWLCGSFICMLLYHSFFYTHMSITNLEKQRKSSSIWFELLPIITFMNIAIFYVTHGAHEMALRLLATVILGFPSILGVSAIVVMYLRARYYSKTHQD